MNQTLGSKIQFFRKRASLSQMQLEIKLGASTGSISRIESGVVNPTKETIEKIINALKLNQTEANYLLGFGHEEPNELQIQKAIEEVHPIFENPTNFSYLIDNRDRIIYVSKGFRLICRLDKLNTENLIGVTPIEMLFNPEYGIKSKIPENRFGVMAVPTVKRWLEMREYATEEPWFKELLENLRQFESFEEILEKAKSSDINVYSEEARFIEIKFLGRVVKFNYSFTPLLSDSRFFILEYKLDVKESAKQVFNFAYE
jgi:transcriptional regulator with XRE-family HTH domain